MPHDHQETNGRKFEENAGTEGSNPSSNKVG